MVTLPTEYAKLSVPERQWVRAEYIRRQKGLCWYCHEDIFQDPPKRVLDKPVNWSLFPKNFLKHPIHLQHNHETGLTEATVHAYCNAVLWEYHQI